MKNVWIAHFESANFRFLAVGRTESLALAALRTGLRRHGKQYDLVNPHSWWEDDELHALEVPVGGAARDWEAF